MYYKYFLLFAFSEPQIEVRNSNLKFVTKRRRKNKNCLVLDGSGRPKLDLMNSVLKHIDSHDDLCSSNANVTQQLLFHSTVLYTDNLSSLYCARLVVQLLQRWFCHSNVKNARNPKIYQACLKYKSVQFHGWKLCILIISILTFLFHTFDTRSDEKKEDIDEDEYFRRQRDFQKKYEKELQQYGMLQKPADSRR